MMSVRCTSPPISVLEVTELIVRELRLRTFSAAVAPTGRAPILPRTMFGASKAGSSLNHR